MDNNVPPTLGNESSHEKLNGNWDNILNKGYKPVRIFCAALFLVSGILKVFSPTDFMYLVSMLTESKTLGLLTIFGIPIIEIYLGFRLLFGEGVKWVTLLLTAGLAFASLYLLVLNPIEAPNCGCFGDYVPLSIDYTFALKNLGISIMLLFTYLGHSVYHKKHITTQN